MSPRSLITLLSLLIILLPFLGFPNEVKTWLFVIFGIMIAGAAQLVGSRTSESVPNVGRGDDEGVTEQDFVESRTVEKVSVEEPDFMIKEDLEEESEVDSGEESLEDRTDEQDEEEKKKK